MCKIKIATESEKFSSQRQEERTKIVFKKD